MSGVGVVAKFLCRCGAVIRVSGPIPNPDEWLLIADEKFDEFPDEVSATVVYEEARSGFECRVCGRLWIFWDGLGREAKCYLPEPDQG